MRFSVYKIPDFFRNLLVLLCHKRAQAFFPLTRGRSLY